MRHVVTSRELSILVLSLVVGSLVGCGVSTPLSPGIDGDVSGEQLTNPKPGADVDGSFVPYIPPPFDVDNDPIPAPPNPGGDPGLTSETGQGGDSDVLNDPVYTPHDNGLDLVIDVQMPTGGSIEIDVENGGNEERVTVIENQEGGEANPFFDDQTGPRYDSQTGKLIVPLHEGNEQGSVWLTFTVKDANGQITNESHGISLPPGWTPVDTGSSGSTRQF